MLHDVVLVEFPSASYLEKARSMEPPDDWRGNRGFRCRKTALLSVHGQTGTFESSIGPELVSSKTIDFTRVFIAGHHGEESWIEEDGAHGVWMVTSIGTVC